VRGKEQRYRWDGLKLRLPVIGPIVHKATLARFSRSFALSAKSGVPIVQVLSIVSEVVDNAYLEARIVQMREAIERGESILRAAVRRASSARWCCRWSRSARRREKSTS